jgi:hypothetical protein
MTKDETLKAIIAGAKANGSWDKKYPDDDKKAQPAQGWKLREVYFDEHGEPIMHREPAQGPVIFYRCKGCGHAYEGVAVSSCDCMEGTGFEQVEYFTAPPKRPWVGLTNQECDAILESYLTGGGRARAIEKALKEKNNG